MNLVLTALHSPLAHTLVIVPLIVIALDLLTGIVAAVRNGTFSTKLLGDFAHHNLLPLLAIFATIGLSILTGVAIPVAASGATAAVTAFTLAQLGSIAENVAEITGLPYSFISSFVSSLFHRGASNNAPIVTSAPTSSPTVAAIQPAAAPTASVPAAATEAPASEATPAQSAS